MLSGIKELIEFAGGLKNILKGIGLALSVLVGSTIISGLGQIATGLYAIGIRGIFAWAMTIGPVILIGALIGALILTVQDLWKAFTNPEADTMFKRMVHWLDEVIPQSFYDAIDSIKSAFWRFVGWIRFEIAPKIANIFKDMWKNSLTGKAVGFISDKFSGFMSTTASEMFAGQQPATAPISRNSSVSTNTTTQNVNVVVNNPSSNVDVQQAIRDEFALQSMEIDMNIAR